MSVLRMRLSPPFELVGFANLSQQISSDDWKDSLELPEYAPEQSGRFNPRLIVLIPAEPIDHARLIRAILPLLVPPVSEIVFLTLGVSGHEVSSERLDALIRQARSQNLKSYAQYVPATQWLHAVEMIVRPGDVVVCHAEQQHGELAKALTQHSRITTHILAGHYPSLMQRSLTFLGKIGFELLPLVLVLVFFWLQVQIESHTVGWITTLGLVISMLIEISLLVLWSLFIR